MALCSLTSPSRQFKMTLHLTGKISNVHHLRLFTLDYAYFLKVFTTVGISNSYQTPFKMTLYKFIRLNKAVSLRIHIDFGRGKQCALEQFRYSPNTPILYLSFEFDLVNVTHPEQLKYRSVSKFILCQ